MISSHGAHLLSDYMLTYYEIKVKKYCVVITNKMLSSFLCAKVENTEFWKNPTHKFVHYVTTRCTIQRKDN
jgi:hypothetical protein